MEVVLADALLARGGDPGELLRAVCAPLSADRAEALRLLLQRLAAGGPRGEAESEALRRAAWEVALERCRPLLRLGDGAAGGAERLRLGRAARGALRHCVQLCGAPLAARLARDALAELAGGGPGAEAAVEALAAAAPRLEEPALVARCAAVALALVREESEGEAAAALVAGRLLPALGGNGLALGRVWDGLLGGGPAPRAGRALLALSALADALLPRGPGAAAADARLCPRFWRLVQEGLTERDGLCRKRARYLLKRAVDLSGGQAACLRCPPDGRHGTAPWWGENEKLLQFWETYILIMETLEENQIHVIKPVLPKLNSLYELAISGKEGCWLFHPSWHMCIYKRMFESENKTLTKEGVLHFLELYETKHLPNSLGFSEFVIGPLMDALSESSLYSRTPGQLMGACPPLGMRLQKFLTTYVMLLPEEEKGGFLLKFIQKMTNRHWCAVPILFLSMALAYIPTCKVLGTDGLHALRDVLQCTMITHQILLRGAAQCYLLQTAMHLTDVVSGKSNIKWIELEAFLNPLLDVLMKLGSNAYIPTLKTDKSLQLLLKLLQTRSLKCSNTQDGYLTKTKILHVLRLFLCEETSSQGWGRIVARYVRDQWICLRFVLNKFPTLAQEYEEGTSELSLTAKRSREILESALEALTILPSDQVLPVFDCMRVLVPKLLNSLECLCIEAFDLAWKIISSLSNTQLIFWSNLKAFVRFIFDNEVLAAAASAKGQAYAKIKEIILKLIDMSTTKTGVFNVVLSHCCQSWILPTFDNRSAVRNAFLNAGNYCELITEGCVFGTVFRRDQSTNRDDHYVRICAIKFLCLLDGSNILHKSFMEDIVIKLLEKDELVSRSRTRYYANSLQHRIKNRVWQTLLVLLPKLDQKFLCGILDKVFQAGFGNNQASVKYFIEWIVILSLHKYPQFLNKFWDCFCYDEEKLKTSICTFLSVLSHFDTILQNTSEKKPILKKALLVVLQWCFNHNFSVRLYALVALKKIWAMCRMLDVEEFEALTPVIESSLQQVENMHGTGNARRNWQRIQDHFFFATFHPLEDYSLETIFYTLPRLSEVAEDEWISLCKFERFTDIPLPPAFQWYRSRAELLDLKPSDWSQQDTGSSSVDADGQTEWTDVQKKIIPWKHSTPSSDLEMVLQDRAAKLGKSNSRLIVVASLIDKPTNLGGLCRTSEIFGASALVVGSLHYVQDKQFQHLSVSAEQWLPLVEVKPSQLVDYLQQKKTEGYTAIGVEQTAKSYDLTEYCFPEKSLLLLGNEHEGIPANLIHHLDVCVEIPQQGIIRSLNVHVSGALLIWEYTRQQVIKHKQQK
uniref:tRNA (guanosine(18)-2'-O)-methyltransferase TARBP1 n=1 Tax=Gallus gallus TaxID=9031 RepID=A0A8V0Y3H4_CHICK